MHTEFMAIANFKLSSLAGSLNKNIKHIKSTTSNISVFISVGNVFQSLQLLIEYITVTIIAIIVIIVVKLTLWF